MKKGWWIAIAVILLAAALVRVRLLRMPLERDEGEYAYAGQLMLQGIPPYRLACNMKLPGTYAAYAVLMAALGQTVAGIHVGLMLVNAGAVILIALLGARLFGAASGVASGAVYALMSLGSAVLGTQAQAEHFAVVAALGGVLLLLRYFDSRRMATLWWSGLLFGLAFLMKQPAVTFGVFGAVYIGVTEWRRPKRSLVYAAALAAPLAFTCLILWRAGVFEKFWFWTFTYARTYASEVSLSDGFDSLRDAFPPILKQNTALWILAVAGVIRSWWKKLERRSAAFATAWLFFSFLAVCPGLYFREHYFVLLLPAVALAAGAAIREIPTYWVLASALALSLFTQREFLFRLSPLEASRELYERNPFPEAIPVASYIRAHSAKTSRVAVLGSEPEIYFYADRHSATCHIYMYGLMEAQPYALRMQEDLIREVTEAAPEFVVDVVGDKSWLRDEDSPARIFEWWSAYRAHYRLVGVAEVTPDGHSAYRWDAAAEGYRPFSDSYLAVYKKER
jgi:hypothetical protein